MKSPSLVFHFISFIHVTFNLARGLILVEKCLYFSVKKRNFVIESIAKFGSNNSNACKGLIKNSCGISRVYFSMQLLFRTVGFCDNKVFTVKNLHKSDP